MWVQIAISLPLAAQRFTPLSLGVISIGGVASVYTINAGLTVVLQYPLLALAQRFLRPLMILTVGVALMGAGLASVILAGSTAGLLGCVALFSIGAILVEPVQLSVTAEMADPSALGSYFGFGGLALAFGGGLGNFAGGWLYDTAAALGQPRLPWLTFGMVGAIVTLGLLLLDRARLRDPYPIAAETRSELSQV
jgi:DHA1 family multidrug resistance protein-like MFS transporter